MYVDWNLPHLSLVLYITSIYTSSMQELIMQEMQQKLERPCFRKRTLDMSIRTIFYSLQIIWLSLLIDLDIETTMLQTTGPLYLWIWPLRLIPTN